MLEKHNVQDILELNMVQKGMLYHYLKESEENLYNVQLSFRIEGDLNVELLKKAFAVVQTGNDALRSVFRWEQVDRPLQIILKECPIDFTFHDLSGGNVGGIPDSIKKHSEADRHGRFDLTRLPVKLTVIKTGSHQFLLNITNHHILYDGWSNAIFLKEFFQAYNGLVNNEILSLNRKPGYKEAQLSMQKNKNLAAEEHFWKNYLEAYEIKPHFSDLGAGSRSEQVRKMSVATTISNLDSFAREYRITKASVIYAAYGILLQKYTAARDIVLGSTVSSRDPLIPGSDQLIGNFINTIPLRINCAADTSLLEIVNKVNADLIERSSFHRSSLYEIKQMLGLRTMDHLFESVVGIENYPVDEALVNSCDGLDIKLEAVYENTNVTLVVLAFFREQLQLEFNYKQSLLSDQYIKDFAGHFVRIIEEILAYPDKTVGSLDMLTAAEKERLLHAFNNTDKVLADEATVIDLFESQVQATPGSRAVVYKDMAISYEHLDRKANRLANTLLEAGIVSNDIVALMVDPSIEMMIGILGILKAGAAYLPVNPDFPKARIHSMYVEAKCKMLLTQRHLKEKLDGGIRILDLDDPGTYHGADTKPSVRIAAKDLLYVIYTSGTTGMPKGVMIKQENLVNYIYWLKDFVKPGSGDKTALVTSFAFDLGYTAVFSAILCGAELHMLEKALYTSPGDFLAYISRHGISYIKMTPSLYSGIVEHPDFGKISTLRALILGGEKIRVDDLERSWKVAPDLRVINHYGPTETTIGVVARYIGREELVYFAEHPSIGKPISNTKCYILDSAARLVPVGAKGELFVGGAGLGEGYLNQPLLTAEKFVANPFVPGTLMYKTGDFARWLPDGNIQFLGRTDQQVKVRGYRVELEEIENLLAKHEGIEKTVVTAKYNDLNNFLVAYYVAGSPIDTSVLRAYLSERLPDYMIPSYFVRLQAMPLTANGKLDRKALPEPEVQEDEDHAGPSNEIEAALVEIWSQAIGTATVSTTRNFFEIGGDSLKLILVNSKIIKRFKRKVAITDLFKYPTIKELARFLAQDSRREQQVKLAADDSGKEPAPVTAPEQYAATDIAIVGMAGRFPNAKNIDEFWQNLKAGKEAITRSIEEDAEGRIVKAKGILEDYDLFESSFFNYTPEEAGLMDPQIRIFHECVWEALEDAGYNPYSYEGTIGLYAGSSHNPYNDLKRGATHTAGWTDQWERYIYSGRDFLCSRVSYKLNLRGPSVNVATACSTSLVAIDIACDDLLSNKCSMAVAGGVSLTFHDSGGYRHKMGMILSPDGYCRAFDKNASGTVGGNGVGVVVLKKLADAINDGDNIHAIIKGSARNNDGSQKVGFTAPSIEGQANVIKAALQQANVKPESISYVEAHGTATLLGDPIEFKGLNAGFDSDKRGFCAVGSVKTNIGHLNAASGVAGLIKTVLSLEHKQLPPSLHYEAPNPEIDIEESPFYVNNKLKEWIRNGTPLRAGVSSFGIGGTNAHIILEEAPVQPVSSGGRDYQVLLFSAKTKSALERNVENFKAYLSRNKDLNLADVAYTLNTGRAHFAYRNCVVCRSREEGIELLTSAAYNQQTVPVRHTDKQRIVFMFPGQGSQYVNMFYDLYSTEEIFRKEVDKCFELAAKFSEADLRQLVFPANNEGDGRLNDTEFTQPLLFIMEYALAQLLMQWGIRPDIMIGHSIGEYVAACISGVFSLESALKIVIKRGALMQRLPPGSMLSIDISEDTLKPLLDRQGAVSLAAVNSSSSCVVSGNKDAIQEFKEMVEREGFRARFVRCSHAFHSYMMDGILEEFSRVVLETDMHTPGIPFISNLSGKVADGALISKPSYWADHLRQTVRFSAGIETLLKDEQVTFVEVGPGNVLSAFVRSNKHRNKEQGVVNTGRHPEQKENDLFHLLSAIGELWINGVAVKWKDFYKTERRRKVSLPTYSFEKMRYPVNYAVPEAAETISETPLVRIGDVAQWFYIPGWKAAPLLMGTATEKKAVNMLFMDDCGIAEALVDKFSEEDGGIICVRKGERYRQLSATLFEIDPGSPEDFNRLFQRLSIEGLLPDRIIHAWSIDRRVEDAFPKEKALRFLDAYLYSLTSIVKAAYKHAGIPGKHIVLLTNDLQNVTGHEAGPHEKSLSLGVLKVISQEYPTVTTSHVDISLSDDLNERFFKALYKEIKHREAGKVVSLRNARRWVQVFDKIKCEKTEPGGLRQEGVYLVTGGLGELGFALSRYLLGKYKAKVIVTGRTELPARAGWDQYLQQPAGNEEVRNKIKRMQALEKEGGKVLYMACDIANKAEMADIIEQSEKVFGQINGVIHGAGIIRGRSKSTIDILTREDFEYQFAAKVTGLNVLRDLMGERALDFCLVTSSLSTILGGLEFAAYAAANIYMDYFITYYNQRNLLHNWTSVNFDGLNLQNGAGEGITPTELNEVFERILSAASLPQIAVSVGDLHKRLNKWINIAADTSIQMDRDVRLSAGASGVELSTAPERVALSSFEDQLLQLWKRFFGNDEITVQDDFFELGGDSLKALTMIGHIHKELNVELSIGELFSHSILGKLSKYIESVKIGGLRQQESARKDYTAIPAAEEKSWYRLSSVQKRLFFLYEFDRSALTYNMPFVIKLIGNLDRDKLTVVFKSLISRHESLRTSFDVINEEPVQRIHETFNFELEYFESNGNHESMITGFIRPFDLRTAPLIRVGLINIAPDEHILVVDLHHIISDGVSKSLFISDFISLYKNEELPELKLHYKDYAEWQEGAGQQQVLAGQQEFWMKEFSDEQVAMELPLDFPRPLVRDHNGNSIDFELNSEEANTLRSIGLTEDATMFMVILSVYSILLSKLAAQEDIVIGTALSGRQHADLSGIIGMFVNTLPIRSFPVGDKTFTDFLRALRTKTLEVFQNQVYPYEALIDDLKIERDTNRNPLFDAVFSYENFELPEIDIPGLTIEQYESNHKVTKFDLTLIAFESDDRILLNLEYSRALFRRETIERFVTYFKKIVSTIVQNPGVRIADIEIITADEKETILCKFNHSGLAQSNKDTFVSLFQGQVLRTPEAAAAVHDGKVLKYRELNERANQLAAYLRPQAAEGSCIPVLMESSLELLVCMLAIFKAGMVYVPLNKEAPLERVVENISDLEARLLITRHDYIENTPVFYNTIALNTQVDHIVFYDETALTKENIDLFKTYIIAARLEKGEYFDLEEGLVLYDGKQMFAYKQLQEMIVRLRQFILNEIKPLETHCAIMLSNPVLRIIALQTLKALNIPFHILSLGDGKTPAFNVVSVLVTENEHLQLADALFWESDNFEVMILMDSYNPVVSKKETEFKKLWNHMAEGATEALNDYGWVNSYTGERFSIREMEEYVNNFKEKLQPYLGPDSRMLEVGCGHGILLFELANKVGYYHATDLSDRIIQKNAIRLEALTIDNVGLEVCTAENIKQVSQRDYDVVVCSSVIHYFPDTIYLERFIKDAIALLKEDGVIYLDDLMNLDEKENLIESVKRYKKEHPAARVKTDWNSDLFVRKEFFYFLKRKYPEITSLEVTKKSGKIDNELTRYRYDVLIKVDKKSGVHREISTTGKRRYDYGDIVNVTTLAGINRSYEQATLVNFNAGLKAILSNIKDLIAYPTDNLVKQPDGDDICYIIYTSGTTGKPKGAMVHHAGMLNHLYAKINDLAIEESDIIAQTAPVSFDISIWQFLVCLLKGGQTHIMDKDLLLSPGKLVAALERSAITIFESVPSLINTLLEGMPAEANIALRHLRWMIMTGEPLTIALVRSWYLQFPGIKLLNAYGPTEASDDITHYAVPFSLEDQATIPIGKPIQHMHVYILDKYLRLCPVGIKGEIYTAGIGVGKGYWKDPEKTKRSFIPNPFSDNCLGGKYDTLYKTGDTGYYLEDGNIICVGRTDDQVKIRGVRIELGEIESLLSKHPSVQHVAVAGKEKGDEKYLVAYYVTKTAIEATELKNFLSRKLPANMIPEYYVPLSALPITYNGKLDRKALPDPVNNPGSGYTAPSNAIEEKLREIWSEILKIDKEVISVDSSFFELGGHSLKAVTLVNKIHKHFEIEIPLREVFNKQNIQKLADYLATVTQIKTGAHGNGEITEISI